MKKHTISEEEISEAPIHTKQAVDFLMTEVIRTIPPERKDALQIRTFKHRWLNGRQVSTERWERLLRDCGFTEGPPSYWTIPQTTGTI